MIAQLTGTLQYKSPQMLIIDINGVGYCATVSLTTFSSLPGQGEKVSLLIHTYVREDTLTLYGFATMEERNLFQRLIAVSGVGPKVALAILSGIPPDHLVAAITGGDTVRLTAIPGVGRKTAERIIVDLKDKLLKDPLLQTGRAVPVGNQSVYRDALSALTNLGYAKVAAEKALNTMEWSATTKLETAIKDALKELIPQ